MGLKRCVPLYRHLSVWNHRFPNVLSPHLGQLPHSQSNPPGPPPPAALQSSLGRNSRFPSPPPAAADHSNEEAWQDSYCTTNEWLAAGGGRERKPELLTGLVQCQRRRTWAVHARLWVGQLAGGWGEGICGSFGPALMNFYKVVQIDSCPCLITINHKNPSKRHFLRACKSLFFSMLHTVCFILYLKKKPRNKLWGLGVTFYIKDSSRCFT